MVKYLYIKVKAKQVLVELLANTLKCNNVVRFLKYLFKTVRILQLRFRLRQGYAGQIATISTNG